jgi:hypothetical protein
MRETKLTPCSFWTVQNCACANQQVLLGATSWAPNWLSFASTCVHNQSTNESVYQNCAYAKQQVLPGATSWAPDLLSFASACVHTQSINELVYQNCTCANQQVLSGATRWAPDLLSFASACLHAQSINESVHIPALRTRKPAGFVRCDQLSSRSVVICLSLCTQSINQSMSMYTRIAHAQTSRFCWCAQ